MCLMPTALRPTWHSAFYFASEVFIDGEGFVVIRFSGLVLCSMLSLHLPQQGESIISSVFVVVFFFTCCSTISF